MSKLISIISILVGVCCIVFSENINDILPYLVGISMLISSVFTLVNAIKEKEYATIETRKTASSITGIILAIIFIIKGDKMLYAIAIFWGVSGLRKSSIGLNIVIYNIINRKKYKLELLHATIEMVISILLILEPFSKLSEHIMILGIEIILNTIRKFYKDKLYAEEE